MPAPPELDTRRPIIAHDAKARNGRSVIPRGITLHKHYDAPIGRPAEQCRPTVDGRQKIFSVVRICVMQWAAPYPRVRLGSGIQVTSTP